MTGLNNIILRNVNIKSYGYDKIYMDKHLIEDNFCQLIDQLNERKINHKDFYFVLLDNVHPFYDGSGRTCKIFVRNFN